MKKIFMTDFDHQKLKAEIDGIIKNIDNTMKKIENIIPVKEDVPDRSQNLASEKSQNSLPKNNI
ncbi:MAG: hypothetical protein KJN80_05715 [Deltaproteobacteria bacterium]|nr:hypothetical protein [Deltaproteobacteria bacterium]